MRETFTGIKEYDNGEKALKPERNLHMLREAEIRLTGGKTVEDRGRRVLRIGISGKSFYGIVHNLQ